MVNPAATEVAGRRAFTTVADLPETPDLACIALPARLAPQAVRECGERGIPAAIVYAGGFAEAGPEGARLQEELSAAAVATGVRLCGPNTAGLAAASARLCATIGMAFQAERPPPGRIAFLTQSGAVGGALLSRAWSNGIGFSHWICAGNEVDLTLGDFFGYLADDTDTDVIAVFLESVRDAERFADSCRRARERGKPVVVYKTGVSEVGQRAVRSHTDALAGDAAV